MKIKAVIFDATGMVIYGKRFSISFFDDYGIPLKDISLFFDNEFQDCLIGQADLKTVIKPYLTKWNWKKSTVEFLDYWFKTEHKIDKNMVKIINDLKKIKVKCFLATNQEKYRIDYMVNKMGFSSLFNNIYASCQLGYKKSQKSFYQILAKKIKNDFGINKNEVLYWDDHLAHVKLALSLGFNAKLYQDFLSFKREINKYLKI